MARHSPAQPRGCACARRARATAICRCAGGRSVIAPCSPRAVPSARRAWRTANSGRPDRRAAPSDRATRAVVATIAILEVAPALRGAGRDPAGRDPDARRHAARAAGGRPSRLRLSPRSVAIAPVTRTIVAPLGPCLAARRAQRPLRRAAAACAPSAAAGCGRPADAAGDARAVADLGRSRVALRRGGRGRRSSGGRPGRQTSIISGSAGFSSAFASAAGSAAVSMRLPPARPELFRRPPASRAQPRWRDRLGGCRCRLRLGDRRSGGLDRCFWRCLGGTRFSRRRLGSNAAQPAALRQVRRRCRGSGSFGSRRRRRRLGDRRRLDGLWPLLHPVAERAQHRGEIFARRAGERRHIDRHGEAAALDRAGRLRRRRSRAARRAPDGSDRRAAPGYRRAPRARRTRGSRPRDRAPSARPCRPGTMCARRTPDAAPRRGPWCRASLPSAPRAAPQARAGRLQQVRQIEMIGAEAHAVFAQRGARFLVEPFHFLGDAASAPARRAPR